MKLPLKSLLSAMLSRFSTKRGERIRRQYVEKWKNKINQKVFQKLLVDTLSAESINVLEITLDNTAYCSPGFSTTVNVISRFFIPNHLSGKYLSLHSHPHAFPKFVCNNNICQFASFSPFCDEKLHGWCKTHRWMGERFPYFFHQHYLSQADAFFLLAFS